MIIRLTCFVWQPSINCCGASTCCVVGLCHLKPFWLFLSCELRTLWVLLRKTRLYSFAGMDIRAISLWLFRKARSLFFRMGLRHSSAILVAQNQTNAHHSALPATLHAAQATSVTQLSPDPIQDHDRSKVLSLLNLVPRWKWDLAQIGVAIEKQVYNGRM